ncbi:peptidase T domain protein, partial [Vibrio parahaemolyticus AQ3810]
AILH